MPGNCCSDDQQGPGVPDWDVSGAQVADDSNPLLAQVVGERRR